MKLPPRLYHLAEAANWPSIRRLNRQRGACRPRPQVVLEIDTIRLVTRYVERIALSRINSGNARRRPAKRGRWTFVPYRIWIESGWAEAAAGHGAVAGRPSPPAELTVAGGAPDILRYVVGVHRLRPGEMFRPPRRVSRSALA